MKPIPLSDLPKKYHAQVSYQLGHAAFTPYQCPAPLLESSVGDGALGKGQAEKADSRIRQIRVVSFRVRLCDEDNLCEKYHIDGLRYLGIIPDDSPDKCHIVTTQQKVSTKKEQRTVITIT